MMTIGLSEMEWEFPQSIEHSAGGLGGKLNVNFTYSCFYLY